MEQKMLLQILGQMTLEEKIALCSGADFWHSKAMPQHKIPAFKMADGPHGVRCQKGEADMLGINNSEPTTCFPTAALSGCSWDTALLEREGAAIGEEAAALGVDIVLGPGVNLKRNPLCGRNFEYFSEDPLVSGRLGTAWVRGAQSVGTGTSVKHFAANNQECKRFTSNSVVDARALRELYLAAFEPVVKEGKPDTVMCAYPRLNGTYCSDNKWLLTDVLRGEWGFDGLVITDWGAMSDRTKGFAAGCDLSMPGGSGYGEAEVLTAVKSGALSENDVDVCALRVLKLAFLCAERRAARAAKHSAPQAALPTGGNSFDAQAHHALAREIAAQSAVLLKNESNLLPLAQPGANKVGLVLIGHMAKHMRYQGAGSSHINPTQLTSLTDAMPNVPFLACCDASGATTQEALREAAAAAKRAKVSVVCAGLPEVYESEGFDRESMAMPQGHIAMIEAVAQANPNTVVVLFGGSAMELPWFDKVKAVLYMGLPGQAGGAAAADLLTGAACPCGKLTETWPLTYADVISRDSFGGKTVPYTESIYVGYRYYEKAQVPVRLPFGHGLSYASFAYSNLCIENNTVSCTVQNTGTVTAKEIVQFYLAAQQGGVHRPHKELKGFCKVSLAPGEAATVSFALDERSFAVWDNGWKTPQGNVTVLVGASSVDIRLRGTVAAQQCGEAIVAGTGRRETWYDTCKGTPSVADFETLMGKKTEPDAPCRKGSFTMNDTVMDMKNHSFVMKTMFASTEKAVAKGFNGKIDYENPTFKMMMLAATDCPLRASVVSSGGAFSERTARGMLALANGHWVQGLRFLSGKKGEQK